MIFFFSECFCLKGDWLQFLMSQKFRHQKIQSASILHLVNCKRCGTCGSFSEFLRWTPLRNAGRLKARAAIFLSQY